MEQAASTLKISFDHPNPNAQRYYLMGSCFSDSMKMQLESRGKQVASNPFGTLFHPHAISQWLRFTMDGIPNEEALFLVEHEGEWRSLMGGKVLRADSKESLRARINNLLLDSKQALAQAECLVITLGTAHGWYYEGKHLVGNCQRLPQQAFEQRLTPLNELTRDYAELLEQLALNYPALKVIVSVSPVKHWRLGIVNNLLGKARLIELAHSLNCTYFPGYEWVSEVLRDYSYYESDGCHPNEIAVQRVSKFFLK